MPSEVVRVKRWVALGGLPVAKGNACPLVPPAAGALAALGVPAFDLSGLDPVATCWPPAPAWPTAHPAIGPATKAIARAMPRVRVRARWWRATIDRRASGVAGARRGGLWAEGCRRGLSSPP